MMRETKGDHECVRRHKRGKKQGNIMREARMEEWIGRNTHDGLPKQSPGRDTITHRQPDRTHVTHRAEYGALRPRGRK